MRTRLTEMLNVEHPVMLAGMGGVSYHRVVAAVSEAGGFGCLGASTMGPEEMVTEIAATAALTDKPFGVDLLTAAPQDMAAKVADMIEGGATVFRRLHTPGYEGWTISRYRQTGGRTPEGDPEHIIEDLASDGRRRLLDVQWVTSHLASLGALQIPRAEYRRRLAAALEQPPPGVWQATSEGRRIGRG